MLLKCITGAICQRNFETLLDNQKNRETADTIRNTIWSWQYSINISVRYRCKSTEGPAKWKVMSLIVLKSAQIWLNSTWIWSKTTLDHHADTDWTKQRTWSKLDDKDKFDDKESPSVSHPFGWPQDVHTKVFSQDKNALILDHEASVVVSLHRLLPSWLGACSVATSWLPAPKL